MNGASMEISEKGMDAARAVDAGRQGRITDPNLRAVIVAYLEAAEPAPAPNPDPPKPAPKARAKRSRRKA